MSLAPYAFVQMPCFSPVSSILISRQKAHLLASQWKCQPSEHPYDMTGQVLSFHQLSGCISLSCFMVVPPVDGCVI